MDPIFQNLKERNQMSDALNTVVSDSELSTVSVPSAPKRGRGRPKSGAVALRKASTVDAVISVLTSEPKGFTVSALVRELEARGLGSKTLWTDVYHFLNFGSHSFFSTGGTGTRVKWSANLPVEPVLTETPSI